MFFLLWNESNIFHTVKVVITFYDYKIIEDNCLHVHTDATNVLVLIQINPALPLGSKVGTTSSFIFHLIHLMRFLITNSSSKHRSNLLKCGYG